MEGDGREDLPGRELILFKGLVQLGSCSIFMLSGVGGRCEQDGVLEAIVTVITSIAFAPIISSPHHHSSFAFKLYERIFH